MAKICRECGREFKGKGTICTDCVEALRHKIPIAVEPASVRTVPIEEIQGGLMAQFMTEQEDKKEEKQFVKNDSGKLQWTLMPFEQLEEVVRVLMKGAEKYGRDNWKNCDDIKRYKDALMRHVVSYNKGERSDPEDNLPHLAHAICNCLFLMYFNSIEDENIKRYLQLNNLTEK